MNKDFLHAVVLHKKYGNGTITKIEDNRVFVQFSENETSFQFPLAFAKGFLVAQDEELQSEFLHLGQSAEKEIEQNKISQYARVEQTIRTMSRSSSKSVGNKFWIKFQGIQDADEEWVPMKVNINGRDAYIIAYATKPNVEEGDKVVVAPSVSSTGAVIIAKGTLEKVTKFNKVKDEWIRQYDWLQHYSWYAVFSELETLKAPKYKGLPLKNVLATLGSDTYGSTQGKNKTEDQLNKVHTKKQHMHLTETSYNYICDELQKLFDEYGSQTYR